MNTNTKPVSPVLLPYYSTTWEFVASGLGRSLGAFGSHAVEALTIACAGMQYNPMADVALASEEVPDNACHKFACAVFGGTPDKTRVNAKAMSVAQWEAFAPVIDSTFPELAEQMATYAKEPCQCGDPECQGGKPELVVVASRTEPQFGMVIMWGEDINDVEQVVVMCGHPLKFAELTRTIITKMQAAQAIAALILGDKPQQ